MKSNHDQKKPESSARPSRRKFIGTAAATGGAAALAFPMISTAQSVTNLRFQSTWPSKDIFHEYALDFAKKVNDMTGGELKIEVLPAGAVVPVAVASPEVDSVLMSGSFNYWTGRPRRRYVQQLWRSAGYSRLMPCSNMSIERAAASSSSGSCGKSWSPRRLA